MSYGGEKANNVNSGFASQIKWFGFGGVVLRVRRAPQSLYDAVWYKVHHSIM